MRFHTLVMLLTLLGCSTQRRVSPNPPVITDQGTCGAACSRLRVLGCSAGLPVATNHACASQQCATGEACDAGRCYVSCERFCVETENAGVWLDPGCVVGIDSCEQIEACPLARTKVPTDTCTGPACS